MTGNGFTRAYNVIFDPLVDELSNAHFKVFYYIYRQLVGWNRTSIDLSITEIMQKTHVSIPTVIACCKVLQKKKLISMEKMGSKKNSPVRFHLGDKLQSVINSVNNQEEKVDKTTESCQMSLVQLLNELITINNDLKDNKENKYNHIIDKAQELVKLFNNDGQTVKENDKSPDLLSKLEFFPGVINLSLEADRKWLHYIQQFPEEQIDIVIEEAKRRAKLTESDKDKLHRKAILKFIAGGLDHFQRFYGGGDDTGKRNGNVQYEASLERVKEMQEQVKRDKQAAGGEEAYHEKIRAMIAEFEKGGANEK